MFILLDDMSSRVAKNFHVGHHMLTLQPNCVIPTMLIGIINFGHFHTSLNSRNLDSGGHNAAQSKPVCSISLLFK